MNFDSIKKVQDVDLKDKKVLVRVDYNVPLKDGKVDIDALEAIAFDPYTHGYYKVGGRIGEAFKDGLKIK